MKKMIKRTSALAISAFMAAQYIPFSAVAYTTDTSDLTIHPYVISDSTYNTRKAAGSDSLTGTESDKPATSEGLDSYANNSLTFKIDSVDADGVITTGAGTTHLTNQASNTTINLPDGKYKITPENNDTDAKFKTAEAFYIQLPVGALKDVHVYPKFTDNDDTGDNSDPGNTTTPNDPDSDTHTIKLNKSLRGDAATGHDWTTSTGRAGFNVYFKNQLGNWEKIMNAAGTAAQVYYTNASGEVIIDGLPLGQYCLVEVDAPGNDDFDYMLDQKPQMFTLDGTTNTNELTLVNDPPLKVTKEIDKDGQGHTFNWTIHADLPTNRANLLSYVITDTYSTSQLKGVTVTAVGNLASTKYNVNTDTDGTIIITITDLSALADITGTTLDISVTSELADAYSTGNVTNSAQITYQYAYDPTGDVPDDIPDPDPTNPTNPSPTPVDYPPTTPTPAVVTPVTLTISNVDDSGNELSDGKYAISGLSTHIDDSSATATIDDGDKGDDLLTLKNLAPGVYTIQQTGTKTGYSIASPDTQTIYIDSNGLVYEGDSATGTLINSGNAGSATITFVNPQITAGFNLPFTGTTATIIFTVTGLILMAGTLFFIIILKKRDDDDEEQENN